MKIYLCRILLPTTKQVIRAGCYPYPADCSTCVKATPFTFGVIICSTRNMKIFNVGNKNDEIHILDKTTTKESVFTPSRWASFLLCVDDIHNQVCKHIEGAQVAYFNHYGGGLNVTVTNAFRGVDSIHSYTRVK